MMKAEMGSGPFSAQYLQSPQPADGAMVKLEWIRDYSGQPDKGNGRIIHSWDTALKGDAGCDYSVCTTSLERGNEHFLLDVFREKLNFPDLVHATIRQHGIHRPEAVIIEEKGSGISLLHTLRFSRGVRAIGRVPTDDKVTRLNRVLPMFEAGQVFFPKDASWRADLVKELLTFPGAMHDDQVDSISQYLAWAGERGRGSIKLHLI